MRQVIKDISEIGIIPVVTVESEEQGVRIMEALKKGGLMAAEVTFRTEAAAEAIKRMKQTVPEAMIGAGTVLTTEQAGLAIEAGVDFIVSPGSTKEVIAYCLEKDVVIIPGCATPSDIQLSLSLGLEIIKFFPAEAVGGLKMLKAMSEPYPNVKFMPTGGISESNVKEYLCFPKVICCGGSWITKPAKTGNYAAVEQAARDAVALVRKVRCLGR